MNTSLDNTDPFAQVLQKELLTVWHGNLHCSPEERQRLVNTRKRELATMLGSSDPPVNSRPVKVPRTADLAGDSRSLAIPASGLPASNLEDSSLSKSAPSTLPVSLRGSDPRSLSSSAAVDFTPMHGFGQGTTHSRNRTRRRAPCLCPSNQHHTRERPLQHSPAPMVSLESNNNQGGLLDRETPQTGTFGRDQPPSDPSFAVPYGYTGFRPRTASAPVPKNLGLDFAHGVPETSGVPSMLSSGETMPSSTLTSDFLHNTSDVGASSSSASNLTRALSNVSEFSRFNYGAGATPPCTCALLAHSATGARGNEDLSRSFGGSGQNDLAMYPFSFSPSFSFVDSAQAEPTDSQGAFPQLSSSAPADVKSYDRSPTRSQVVQTNRAIAPKPAGGATAVSERKPPVSIGSHQVNRITSADGSSKDVVAISKAPYVRPHFPKKMCPHCTDYKEGFRGEHELRRHIDRAHASFKKMWICVDPTPQKNFLASCKSCRNVKKYNAYYNAAAHLRRAHFNPRKHRGRGRGRVDEKRGGKGGGDHPPMDELKRYMEEIEVHIPDQTSNKSDEDEDVDTEDSTSARNLDGSETFDFSLFDTDLTGSSGDAAIPTCFPEPPFGHQMSTSQTTSVTDASTRFPPISTSSTWAETWPTLDANQLPGVNDQSLVCADYEWMSDPSAVDCSPTFSSQHSPWSINFDDADLPFPMQQ